jgi:hypothetical protein
MSEQRLAARQRDVERREGDYGTELVAWVLIFLALGAFAPCVLLPEWREYQTLSAAEHVQQHRLDSLKSVVERERRALEATRDDPAVIARLARRELSFRHPAEQPVLVAVPAIEAPPARPFSPRPVPPHPLLQRVAASLPELDYDAVFCDGQSRGIIMAMSVALIGVALWLPRGRSSETEADNG